jgi:hypothetical protein
LSDPVVGAWPGRLWPAAGLLAEDFGVALRNLLARIDA